MNSSTLDSKVLEILNSRVRKLAVFISQAVLIVGLFAGWMALEGTGRWIVGGIPAEAPLRKHPEILVLAWLLLISCIFGFRWSKNALANAGKEVEVLLKGVTIDDLLCRSVDKASSEAMGDLVGIVEKDPHRAMIGYAAIKNWEDGSKKVFESLLSSIENIKLIAPMQTKRDTAMKPMIIWLSFSPIVVALVLGAVMVASPTLILNKALGQTVLYLFFAGVTLPMVVAVIPVLQQEKRSKETNYIKRLSTQQVAWMGLVWGDYAMRELALRAKNGDAAAKPLLKIMNVRRAK